MHFICSQWHHATRRTGLGNSPACLPPWGSACRAPSVTVRSGRRLRHAPASGACRETHLGSSELGCPSGPHDGTTHTGSRTTTRLRLLLPLSASSGETPRRRPGGRTTEQALNSARPPTGCVVVKTPRIIFMRIAGTSRHLCVSAGCLRHSALGELLPSV